ncbi:MAG TPA: nuclease A inhibitor family protein [Gemmatimonadaceae bacterium]|nr:nuclease A inhibitor family protein [Gemmatimonadaceae bacterium]
MSDPSFRDPSRADAARGDATSGDTRARLERAVAGLVYSSEGDAPFTYVELAPPGAVAEPVSPALVARLAGAPAGSRLEERTLDAFLARHRGRVDPADAAAQALRPRYDALAAVLRETLADPRAVRVVVPGRAEVRCYVVGRDARGAIAGLATTAIET